MINMSENLLTLTIDEYGTILETQPFNIIKILANSSNEELLSLYNTIDNVHIKKIIERMVHETQ